MRRPGLGSAIVRLIAVGNAVLWLLGMPEMLQVRMHDRDARRLGTAVAETFIESAVG